MHDYKYKGEEAHSHPIHTSAIENMAFLFQKMVFLTIFFLAIIIWQSQAIRSYHPREDTPFKFIQKLKGCHKGETVKNLHSLKKYLHHFGYIADEKNNSHYTDDSFDDLLESALKTYQLNYHLNMTGELDDQTVQQMMKPRCGVADIMNGTSSMTSGKPHHHHLHTVAHYSFFTRNPRWPPSKAHLTYHLIMNNELHRTVSVEGIKSICARAFDRWSKQSHFTFEEVPETASADIHVGFFSRNHGDDHPFDGAGGVLAHAFAPTQGWFHYDADESWAAANPSTMQMDLESVAVHEIGHLLGLGHTSVPNAIMYPSISSGVTKVDLHQDDIEGIRALYGST